MTVPAGTRIQSVARAARVLLWIAERPQGRVAKEVAFGCELGLATTYHLLNTLVDEGLLTKTPERRYVLGPNAALLARAYLGGRSLSAALLTALRDLARRTGETAYLADWGFHETRVLASVVGNNLVRPVIESGRCEHAHARADGKVLLAYALPEVREAYLRKHALTRLTPITIGDPRALRHELAQVRRRGYAFDEEESAAGVCSVAAPLLERGRLTASLALALPSERFRRSRAELTREVLRVAVRLRDGEYEASE